jgi:N-acylneuraminate cytidylyltransferase
MNQNIKNICIIPIRKGSKGIKNKNIKNFNGKPLAYYTIKAALDSKIFSKIFVTHNSIFYKKKLQKFLKRDKSLFFFNRSEETATDKASTESAILEIILNNEVLFKKDVSVFLIQVTSPLVSSDDLVCGYNLFKKKKYDSIFSSYRKKIFIWKSKNPGMFMVPFLHNPFFRKMKQDREYFYIENGAFYIFKVNNFLKNKNRLHGKIGSYVMPEIRSMEIDDINEFKICEKLKNI